MPDKGEDSLCESRKPTPDGLPLGMSEQELLWAVREGHRKERDSGNGIHLGCSLNSMYKENYILKCGAQTWPHLDKTRTARQDSADILPGEALSLD